MPLRPARREIAPAVVADALLSALVSGEAVTASLRYDEGGHTLELRHSDGSVDLLEIDDDSAAALTVRLAAAASLNPVAEAGTEKATANVARIAVTDGRHRAEVLVAIAATSRGFCVDLRALTVDGREPAFVRSVALKRCVQCAAFAAAHEDVCPRDGGALEPATEDARIGGTIGTWVLGPILGEGGMGVVFAAHHALLGRRAAIKVVRRSLGQSRSITDRFLSEARAASRLRHPGVVEVYDYGVLGDSRPYFVMELIEGRSLAAELGNVGAFEPFRALRVARDVANALGAAHRAGVIHHDLKPSNIMLVPDGVKLVDFGAAAMGETDESPKVLFGTPRYTSPERARGERGDGRSDIYSLGIVLYEILSGAAPFDGPTADDLFLAHIADEPPPLALDTPAVVRIVQRALAKSPAERYQDADELIGDIDRALAAAERSEFAKWLP